MWLFLYIFQAFISCKTLLFERRILRRRNKAYSLDVNLADLSYSGSFFRCKSNNYAVHCTCSLDILTYLLRVVIAALCRTIRHMHFHCRLEPFCTISIISCFHLSFIYLVVACLRHCQRRMHLDHPNILFESFNLPMIPAS